MIYITFALLFSQEFFIICVFSFPLREAFFARALQLETFTF